MAPWVRTGVAAEVGAGMWAGAGGEGEGAAPRGPGQREGAGQLT